MTVAELIKELLSMPNQNAKVHIDVIRDDNEGVYESAEVEDARNEGPYVLIRSK